MIELISVSHRTALLFIPATLQNANGTRFERFNPKTYWTDGRPEHWK